MNDCLFCAIAAGEIPADIIRRSGDVVVFRDINPQAPTHLLAITASHFADVSELVAADVALAGDLLTVLTQVALELGLDDGYRIVFNTGTDGGQTVGHVHAHLLAGRRLSWPPG